jgi:hypothetical protein
MMLCVTVYVTDKDILPSLAVLQGGLANEAEYTDDFLNVVTRLVKVALNDPGIPNPREVSVVCWLLVLGSTCMWMFNINSECSNQATVEYRLAQCALCVVYCVKGAWCVQCDVWGVCTGCHSVHCVLCIV